MKRPPIVVSVVCRPSMRGLYDYLRTAFNVEEYRVELGLVDDADVIIERQGSCLRASTADCSCRWDLPVDAAQIAEWIVKTTGVAP